MAYKYTGIQPNAEQMGMWIEETVDATDDDEVTVTYTIAHKMQKEFWIHDPSTNSSYTNGVAKLYNNDTTTNIYANIDTVSGKVITTTAGVTSGDSITVGYYAIGTTTGAANICPLPNLTVANSPFAREESFESHLNAINFKSPWNLPQLGYKWADILATKEISGSDISGAGFGLEFRFDPDNDTNDTTDWHVDCDTAYPIMLEEIRFIVDDTGIQVEPYVITGSRTTDSKFGEGGSPLNEYIDLSTSSCTYKTNDASVWINSIPVCGMICDEVQVYMKRTTMGTGDTIRVELCGWYKRKMGA